MVTYPEAKKFVLEDLASLAPVEIALDEALGCVAAEALLAREPSPRFNNSAMDGFALRSADTRGGSARLRIVGAVFAGDSGDVSVGEGEAVRIMTGAPVPVDADGVCMREEATVEDGGEYVVVHPSIALGQFVRLVGDDVAVGDVLVDAGATIGPAMLGVLIGQGFNSARVIPRAKVGVLSTGNELVGPGQPLGPGAIRDTNRPSLLASLRLSGFTPVDLGIVGDTREEITAGFERALRDCDAVISTGGVSVGDADFVKSVLADLTEGRARSMQVAIKPGKPFAFGVTSSGAPLFGLAGNPVSTLVGFELFVRPALRLLSGHHVLERPTISMVLDCPLPRHRDGKVHFVHVVTQLHPDGRVHVERAARQGSHLLNAITDATAIAIVPDGEGLAVGDDVRAMVIDADQLSGA